MFRSAWVVDRRHGNPFQTRSAVPAARSDWPTGPRSALTWSRLLGRGEPNGVIFCCPLAGGVCLTLVNRAADTFPVRPELSLQLALPALAGLIETVGNQLG